MEVNSHCHPSVLGMDQSAQPVAVDVTNQQVSAVRKHQGRDAGCRETNQSPDCEYTQTGNGS